jgi:tRNA(Ile)-lysidine synthase
MSIAASVRHTIRRHALLAGGDRVAVALSGGPDSVALVHLLRELEAAGDLAVAGLAHFNHQLRGPAADADERFCRDLAARLGLPIEVGRADVRAAARLQKRSIEDTARHLRYEFLRAAAVRLGAAAMAVGHSLDDQAETFLLRLIRGSGTRGLGSIWPRAGVIIRPLIDVPRSALRQYAAEHGLAFQDDATNADLSVPRNRVRHELLPYLAREFSPNIVEVLARDASLARDDDERLEREAIELAASVVLSDTDTDKGVMHGRGAASGRVVIDATALASMPAALASRIARLALERQAAGGFVGFDAVQRLLGLARDGEPGMALSLPGQQVRLRVQPASAGAGPRRVVELGAEPARPSRRPGNGDRNVGNHLRFSLSIPGEVVLPDAGLSISAAWAERGMAVEPVAGAAVLVSGVGAPLEVRFRRAGDRFHPPGMGGRAKKLQDYLVDRKVDRGQRDLLPLVVDRDDRIVWIVGHAVAEGCLAAGPSPGVILLKARHLGGEV